MPSFRAGTGSTPQDEYSVSLEAVILNRDQTPSEIVRNAPQGPNVLLVVTATKITDLGPQFANFREYWLGWGQAGRADDDLAYYRSGLPHEQANGVLRLRDSGEVGQALARATNALAGVPWLWWVGPDSAPEVADRLLEQGARSLGSMSIMAVELDRVAAVTGPPELRIETVEGAESLAEWVRTYGPSFGVPPELMDETVRLEAAGEDATRMVRLIARIESRPVGTALLFDAHGVAGIYSVTAAEGHRRRGVGAMLTAAAVESGLRRGLRIGTLRATESGAPLYARMDFEKVAEYRVFQPPTRTRHATPPPHVRG